MRLFVKQAFWGLVLFWGGICLFFAALGNLGLYWGKWVYFFADILLAMVFLALTIVGTELLSASQYNQNNQGQSEVKRVIMRGGALWNVLFYSWVLLGILLSAFAVNFIFNERIISFIWGHRFLGFIVLGSLWVLGIVALQRISYK